MLKSGAEQSRAVGGGNYFTVKKTRIEYVLSLLVFSIHISALAKYKLTGQWSSLFSTFQALISSLNVVAVPLFFIISGALFYRNYELCKTKEKILSRVKSLVLPFLFWNFVWTAFDVICSYSPLHQFFNGRSIISLSPEELLSRIILGTHSPFWFIRVIIIFTLSCPIIFTLIKNRYIGLGSIVIAYALYANGISLPEQDPFFFRGDSIVFYLIGAYIGRHHFKAFSTRRTLMVARFSFVLFVACCFVNICFASTMHPAWTIPIWGSQAILLWIAFDSFENNHYYRFEMDSFLVFAMHVKVSAVVSKLLFIALPKAPVFAGINYCFTIIGTLMIVCCFSLAVDRCPSSIQHLTRGGR